MQRVEEYFWRDNQRETVLAENSFIERQKEVHPGAD